VHTLKKYKPKGESILIKISVSIDVSSLKKAEVSYVEAIGCKKVRDQGSNMVVLSVENSDIY